MSVWVDDVSTPTVPSVQRQKFVIWRCNFVPSRNHGCETQVVEPTLHDTRGEEMSARHHFELFKQSMEGKFVAGDPHRGKEGKGRDGGADRDTQSRSARGREGPQSE